MKVPLKFWLLPFMSCNRMVSMCTGEVNWHCNQGVHLGTLGKQLLWMLFYIHITLSRSANHKWVQRMTSQELEHIENGFWDKSGYGIRNDWIFNSLSELYLYRTWLLSPHHSPSSTQSPSLVFGEGKWKVRGRLKHGRASTASST